jgi:methionine--tRNA ligase beta chain
MEGRSLERRSCESESFKPNRCQSTVFHRRHSESIEQEESRVLQLEAMATLTIEEFKQVDLRVGTVLAASPHTRADRLLVLEVDLGNERRQLVAGIRAHYAAEDLVGKQVIVVANLTPATLRGVESQGMVLAASDDEGRLALIGPQQPIAPGATVR